MKKPIFLFLILGMFLFGGQNFWEKTDNLEGDNQVIFEEHETTNVKDVIKFLKVNNQGEETKDGLNYVIIFNPKSERLDFKVNIPLSQKIYDCLPDEAVEDDCKYSSKTFGSLISEENAELNGKMPFAAINADYIDPENHPQGFNVSRGVEYSGDFKNSRSSFAIGKDGEPTIQIGERNSDDLNYNVVGGNGRFYRNGQFEDICEALGDYACSGNTERSMVAITSKGWVIFLVHEEKNGSKLLPEDFGGLLEKIALDNDLGEIREGMLFDGGNSPGMMYDGKTHLQNFGKIGSVFLIYLD